MRPIDEIVKQYDHVAIAVRDIDKALQFFVEGLGAITALPKHHSEAFNFYIAEVVLGVIKIELIQDADPQGPVSKFIEKKGEGFHHISFLVDDMDEVVSALENKGIELIGKKTDSSGDKYVYISPKQSFGTLIQYWQYGSQDQS